MMKRILLACFMMVSGLGWAQQSPLYSQYILNDFVINPAIAGSKPYFPLRLNAREQWEGFDLAPSTQGLSFHAPVGDGRVGLGGIIFQDDTKPTKESGMMLTYAYHLRLDDIKSRLSFGLSGMMYQYTLDQQELVTQDPDLTINGGVYSEIVPDAAVGLYMYGDNYYIGASLYQLFETTFKESMFNIYGHNKGVHHYFFMAGYTAEVHKSFHIEPSIMVKTIANGPVQIDINTRAIFNRNFWTGLSLRTDRSIVALMGFNAGSFHFAYGFDWTSMSIGQHTSGSHELSVGFNIPDSRRRRHIYYWR